MTKKAQAKNTKAKKTSATTSSAEDKGKKPRSTASSPATAEQHPPFSKGKEPEGVRDSKGRFKKGYGGGPGRPKGAKDRLSLSVLQKLQASGNDVAQKVLEMAIDKGDVQAARIVIERLVAKADSQPIKYDFVTALETASDVDQELTGLLHAVAQGRVTPGQSKYLRELLESKAEAIQRSQLADVRGAFSVDESTLQAIRSNPALFAAASKFTALLGAFFIDRQHPVLDVAGQIAEGADD